MKTANERWKYYGVNITLTEKGLDELAKMIANGCPSKFVGYDKLEPISCPLHSSPSPGNMCFRCWKKHLKNMSTMEE